MAWEYPHRDYSKAERERGGEEPAKPHEHEIGSEVTAAFFEKYASLTSEISAHSQSLLASVKTALGATGGYMKVTVYLHLHSWEMGYDTGKPVTCCQAGGFFDCKSRRKGSHIPSQFYHALSCLIKTTATILREWKIQCMRVLKLQNTVCPSKY